MLFFVFLSRDREISFGIISFCLEFIFFIDGDCFNFIVLEGYRDSDGRGCRE